MNAYYYYGFSCSPGFKKKVKRRCFEARLNDYLFFVYLRKKFERRKRNSLEKYNELHNSGCNDF